MVWSVVRYTVVAALAGAVLSTAYAGEKQKSEKIVGIIKAVDAKAGTITIEHKQARMVFVAAPDIKFGSKGENVNYTLANLALGDNVTIHYTAEGEKLIAHKVSRVDTGEKKTARDAKRAD